MPDAPEETMVSITVNGEAIEAKTGELLIDAAERTGTYIPRFCYHNRMDPVGMCRMCLVDIDTGRGPALQPSCMITVSPDMVVDTESERVKKAQDGVLEFLLINHPLDCPVCDKGGECPLQDHTVAFGPGESRFVEEKRHYEKPISISENVYLDRERCILCDRCTRFAKDVAGDALISFQDRGNGMQLNTFPNHPFASYFSGNTVQICPVGALTARPYRFKARPWDLDVVESTCQDCAVGCRIVVDGSWNRVLRYNGVDSEPVNWSWLCDKGRFGFEAVTSEDRLTAPLIKGANGTLIETRWNDALATVARAVKAGLDRNGPSGTAVIGGARLTNESAYAWAKLAKGIIGTDSVDAQLGDGLPASVVNGLPRATIEDACTTGGTVLVIGSDPKDELPVLFLRLRDAVTRRGAKIIELSPRPTSLTGITAHSLRNVPGAVNQLVDQIIAGRDGHGPVRDLLAKGQLTVLLGRASLAEGPGAVVAAAASLLAAFPDVRFLSGLRRSNVHGALDLGLTPGFLPGRVTREAGADWYGDAWGSVPTEDGRDTAAILTAAAAGEIDTLILLGADPLADFPDRDLALRGVDGARTVIAIDTFLNESSAKADVVLPAAGPAEVDGTVTNIEGRVTVVRKKVTAPGTARDDWMIAAELAFRLGADLGFSTIDEIWEEIERLSPAHAGITVETLGSEPDGVLAGRSTPPVTTGPVDVDTDATPAAEASAAAGRADAVTDVEEAQAHEADATVAEADKTASKDEAIDGEGTEEDVEPAAPTGPTRPEQVTFEAPSFSAPAVDAYSLRLVTTRRLYDHGTLVSKSPSLAGLARPGSLLANPSDLERLGVVDGDAVTVISAKGQMTTPVRINEMIPAGTVVLSWNQGDPSPNVLIDSSAGVTEVRLETRA